MGIANLFHIFLAPPRYRAPPHLHAAADVLRGRQLVMKRAQELAAGHHHLQWMSDVKGTMTGTMGNHGTWGDKW